MNESNLRVYSLWSTIPAIAPYLPTAYTDSFERHGECFVLDDGGEADLDLGNYERYLGVTLGRDNNITTGKIYQHVIEKERRGDYLGKTGTIVLWSVCMDYGADLPSSNCAAPHQRNPKRQYSVLSCSGTGLTVVDSGLRESLGFLSMSPEGNQTFASVCFSFESLFFFTNV